MVTMVSMVSKVTIYPLKFGFREKYSKVHAHISFTENIRKILDEGNSGCAVFL